MCNGHILFFKATIGQLPLLGATDKTNKSKFFIHSLRSSFQLKLLKFKFTTDKGQELTTAASGCMILHKQHNGLASKLIQNNGNISVLISSPNSVVVYYKILLNLLYSKSQTSRIPQGIGYIGSNQVKIETGVTLPVNIDGDSPTNTPLDCQFHSKACHINTGENYINEATTQKESVKIIY